MILPEGSLYGSCNGTYNKCDNQATCLMVGPKKDHHLCLCTAEYYGRFCQHSKYCAHSGNFSIHFLRQYVPLLASIAAFVVPIVDFLQKKFLLTEEEIAVNLAWAAGKNVEESL